MTVSSRTARQVGALLTAAVGVMNILSALYPAIPGRMAELKDLVPVHLIRGAETATVLVGFFLIVLADGLRKRRKRAMQITVALLLASSALNVIKGLDFEEATVAAVLAIGLVANAGAFAVSSPLPAPRRLLEHVAKFALLYYCYLLAGFLILRHMIRPTVTISGATLEPFRLLFDQPHYRYLTPHAMWFERSVPLVGGIAVLFAVTQVLRPLIPRRRATTAEVAHVRRLVERYGNDTLSYFSLQDGRHYFFDSSGEAFLSYRLWGNVALVGGDPIGSSLRISQLVDSFLEYVDSNGMDICLLGISSRYLQLYSSRGLRTLKIGEEAVIDLQSFDASALKRKVRRAVRHIGDLNVQCVTYRRQDVPEGILAQMQEISREWVTAKGGAERGFSMTLGRLPRHVDTDCEITVAVEGDYLWGYVVMVPVYRGSAWSLDAMRRRPESPNGLMEALVVHSAGAYRDRGFSALSLNFATLSNCENDIDSRTLEGTRRLLFENLSSVYQLRSLQQFNDKFGPQWRSRYVAYRDVMKFPKLALAIVQSEDPIRLPSLTAVFRR